MQYRKAVVSLFLLVSLCTSLMTDSFSYQVPQKQKNTVGNTRTNTETQQQPTEARKKEANPVEKPRKIYEKDQKGHEPPLPLHSKKSSPGMNEEDTQPTSIEEQQRIHQATESNPTIQPMQSATSEIYWVDAGANGDGTSDTNAAGNITYVLNNKITSNDIIKVQPGTYNTTIGEDFPLSITNHENITLESTGTPSNTLINGTKTHSGINITTDENTITGFTIANFADENDEAGIKLKFASNNLITNSIITNNKKKGILLRFGSNNNIIMNNTVFNNFYGIEVGESIKNTITNNNLTNDNNFGIFLWDESNTNNITDNTIVNNEDGIRIMDSSTENLVCRNNFVGNSDNAEDRCGENAFNTSTIGNYWEDYTGNDANGDGIGDTPYDISGDGGSTDYLPAIEPFNLTIDTRDPSVSIISPSAGETVTSNSVTVEWTGNMGRTEIDYYEVRNDSGNWIRVDTATTYTFVNTPDGEHTVTVKAVDEKGNIGTASVTFTVNRTEETTEEEGTSPIIFAELSVGVAAVAIGVAVYLLRKRRKSAREEEAAKEKPAVTEKQPHKDIEEAIIELARAGEARTLTAIAEKLDMSKTEVRAVIQESDRLRTGE